MRFFQKAAVTVAAAMLAFVGLSAIHAQSASADIQISAGGATFPDPIYQEWIKQYVTAHPDVQLNYAAKGSGAGIGGLIDKTFDFAGSDAPMNKDELAKAVSVGGDVVQVPSVAGAVVLAYNIPNLSGQLKLSGPVLADIYLGNITRWNDPAIKTLNPDLNLPDDPITTVHRSDGSGTNFVFSSYLCTQSTDFQTKVNFGKSVSWPNGQAGQGNAGVTQAIQKTEGSIGYIELNYAVKNNISFALMQNKNGKFVLASPQTVSNAGEGAVADMDEKKILTVRLWSREGDDVYPIASFTYLICYRDLSYLKDKVKAQAIVDYFWFATHDGQSKAPDLAYAPLSSGVQQRVEAALDTITFDGQPLHAAGK